MPMVLAMHDIPPQKIVRKDRGDGPGLTTTTFFRSSKDSSAVPTIFMVRQDPGFYNNPHYHEVDEFQIVMEGKAKFGRHPVQPYYLHFARAYTPYGPLISGDEIGWTFMTLRARHDEAARHFPESKEALKKIPNHQPLQISKAINFPESGSGRNLEEIGEFKDDRGLLACTLSMGPGDCVTAPDPKGGDGQFIVVIKGSLIYESREHKALAVVYVNAAEAPFSIFAGNQGLQGFLLNLPLKQSRPAPTKHVVPHGEFSKWQCSLCAFSYDESLGLPGDGIPAGTRWEDVPDAWSCPDCSANKSEFELQKCE